MPDPLNDKPFTHFCRHGTQFRAARCDFKGGVTVIYGDISERQRVSDVAEMIGWHAGNIWPELDGFAGYDCIDWTIEQPESAPPPDSQKDVDIRS